MRAKLGMPTLIELAELEDSAALARSLGLDFVEINMNLPICQPERLNARALKRLKERYGVGFTIHLDENLNPFDFNRAVAEAWRLAAAESIRLAREAECPVLTMHLARGVYFTLPEERIYLFQRYREEYLSGVRAFRDQYSVVICLGEPIVS